MLICYTDSNNEKRYEIAEDLSSFKDAHPGAVTQYIFNENERFSQADNFEVWATYYGLQPSDADKKLKNERGETLQFVGFRTQNRKYPVILYNETTHRTVKCSAKYARNLLHNAQTH